MGEGPALRPDQRKAFGRAILKGFAVSKIAWARKSNRIISHHQQRFAFGEDWKPRLCTWTNMTDGIDCSGRAVQARRHRLLAALPRRANALRHVERGASQQTPVDPGVIRLRPDWEYRHGETRTPMRPRRLHLSWHGKIYRHDDPWWLPHYPPNDSLCSCGMRTLSDADLKKRGKPDPDPSPSDLTEPHVDPVSGRLVEKVPGVGYGWDYMPGDLGSTG